MDNPLRSLEPFGPDPPTWAAFMPNCQSAVWRNFRSASYNIIIDFKQTIELFPEQLSTTITGIFARHCWAVTKFTSFNSAAERNIPYYGYLHG
jgi:hypothetical protein